MTQTIQEQFSAEAFCSKFTQAEAIPFSFRYNGQSSHEFLGTWTREDRENGVAYTDPDTGLEVRCEVTRFDDFPAVEWVMYLRNTGATETPILEDIHPLDDTLPCLTDSLCTFRYATGSLCTPEDFAPRKRTFWPGSSVDLTPDGGRSSNKYLPFFNIDMQRQGVILAIGWSGQWAAHFGREQEEPHDGPTLREGGTYRLRAGMERTHLRLRAGEEIRTPRIALLFWEGDWIDGQNSFRRFLLAHHTPRPNGQIVPNLLSCGNWGATPAEVHLDNLRKIIEHDLPFDTYWIDAGWFGDPEKVWWAQCGDWNPSSKLYPEGFTPISNMAHQSGRKFLLWFEPLRVSKDSPLAQEHPEWLLTLDPSKARPHVEAVAADDPKWVRDEALRNQINEGDALWNLGNPDARQFLTDLIAERIGEYGIDVYRQDGNIATLDYWRRADAPDRQGITEIRWVEGWYAFWDELLERFPHLIIDNCSSGTRWVDLETLGRSVVLWQTDYTNHGAEGVPEASQCHGYGLSLWLPIHGIIVGAVVSSNPKVPDWNDYQRRSPMAAMVQVQLVSTGDTPVGMVPSDFPYDRARRILDEIRDLQRYYRGDFYPLTEYSLAEDAWLAYQLDLPEMQEGLVVAFRRPLSPCDRATLPLRGLQTDQDYELTDIDTGRSWIMSGKELLDSGVVVELPSRPASALIRYARLQTDR